MRLGPIDSLNRWAMVAAGWVALCGVYPVAEPEHDLAAPGSALDYTVHVLGVYVLVRLWRADRRVRRG